MAEDKVRLEIEVPRKDLRRFAQRKKRDEPKEESEDKDKKEIGGYEPAEILKAPLEPPEPSDKKPPNRHQQRVIFFGFAFVLLSPLLLFVSLVAFIVLALAGAGIVAFGSLVRV